MKITTELVLDDAIIQALYPTYVDAWEPLLVHAAARHVLTADEFAAEMTDKRIEKYVVWDVDSGAALALTTLTTDMSAIPWINDLYFSARYPDAAARDALFYLGYTLVDRHHRRSSALLLMAERINRRVQDAEGVVGFDICDFNNAHGIGRRVARLFSASHRIEPLDTQSYYAADYRNIGAPRRFRSSSSDGTAAPAPDSASYKIVTLADREDLIADIPELLAARWPAFMLAGRPGHEVDLEGMLMTIPEKQVLLIAEDDALAGAGLSVPLYWDGSVEGLPAGWDDAVTRSADLLEKGQLANTLCALSITLSPEASGQGLASTVMGALNKVAGAAGAESLITPVRPSKKANYPLTPMERYLTWRNPKGDTFDPWLRLHQRLGAQILGICPVSMTITGTVAEWEGWLEQALPDTDSYVIAGGLSPLRVDREADLGVYQEPNVWVRHQPTP